MDADVEEEMHSGIGSGRRSESGRTGRGIGRRKIRRS